MLCILRRIARLILRERECEGETENGSGEHYCDIIERSIVVAYPVFAPYVLSRPVLGCAHPHTRPMVVVVSAFTNE